MSEPEIWPSSSVATFSPPRVDIDQVNFGVGYFRPKTDITPLESARLAVLFAVCAVPMHGDKNIAEFIERHALGRHFDKDPT